PTKNPYIAVYIAAFLFPPNNIDHRVPNRVIAVLVGVLDGIEEPLPILQRAKLVTLYLVYPTSVNRLYGLLDADIHAHPMLARKVLTIHKPEGDREVFCKLFNGLPGPVRRTPILDNHLIDDLTSENNPLQKGVMRRQGIVNRHQASYSNPFTSSHRI